MILSSCDIFTPFMYYGNICPLVIICVLLIILSKKKNIPLNYNNVNLDMTTTYYNKHKEIRLGFLTMFSFIYVCMSVMSK